MLAERYRAEMRYPGYMGVGLEVSVKVYPSIKRVAFSIHNGTF